MDKQQEFALRTVEERDVRFIRLWFTDVLGTLKSVAIAPAELEAAFEEGIGFDGSAIEGMTRVSEDDMIVKPDPSTFQILPWRGGPQGTARMFCDVLTPEGEPSLSDPRHVLKRSLSKAKEKGFTFYVHPEIEFYLFEKQDDWSKSPVPIDQGGYFDHVPRSPGMDFRRATVNMLEQMGISVEYSHHEAGPGQNEIDLRYADALTIADNIMTFRTVVKEISLERGIHASFMPKPLADAPGSGMHTHLSLFEGDANAFYEAGQEFNMSLTARQFAAGILHHAAEICAVTDQYVNSYKRLWVSVYGNGLYCYQGDQLIKHFTASNSPLTYDVIHDIMERDNQLWVATDGGGINIISLDDFSFTNIQQKQDDVHSFPANTIYRLYLDPANNMWAGSVRAGLIHIKEAGMKIYSDAFAPDLNTHSVKSRHLASTRMKKKIYGLEQMAAESTALILSLRNSTMCSLPGEIKYLPSQG